MVNQDNPEAVLLAVINKVLEFSNEGKQAKAQHILPFVYESTMRCPQLLWNNVEIWKVAKSLLVMHHYDMVEEEEDELKMLQMALVFSQRAIELCESSENKKTSDYFNALHTQIMLLTSCSDYYVDTLADLCSKTVMSSEERVVAMRLANKILPMLAYNVVVKVDDTFENFNGDEFLSEICQDFEENNPDVTPKQLDDALKIHKMLVHTYLKLFK
ncbi:MAG: hypothetical protein MJ198_03545 [Bacteroidales bacterium]|nr:hypothetical protein [Bacteroidales bacterium]